MLDLAPATRALAEVVTGVRDDQLDNPTPCTEATVAALLDHVDSFTQAFAAAAAKRTEDSKGRSAANADRLAPGWRTRIPERLDALAEAWRDPAAWSGMTRAGGFDMPGGLAGAVAVDELILHGWDIAVASGQSWDVAPELVQAAYGFVHGAVAQNPNGTPGLFGPPVPVPGDAPLLDRLLGLSGRDPQWRAGASR